MNSTPNTARFCAETSQRSLANRISYCRRPTKLLVGSIRELVIETQIVQVVEPQ